MTRAKTDPFLTLAAALVLAAAAASASPPKIDAFTVDTAASQSTIRFTAEAGSTYELQRASVLAPTSDWATVDTRLADATGPMELTDAVPTERPRSFYRIAEAAAPVQHNGVQLWEGGPYWADTNLGAEKPEDAGLYFWWGDTVGYRREGSAWVASDGSSTNFSFGSANAPTYGKYDDELRSAGWTTAEGVLAPEHDAAQVQWGGGWRMPTDQELKGLIDNCDGTWTTQNGVNGCEVRGRGNFAENSIFVPAAGNGDGTSLRDSSYVYLWSSVPLSGRPIYSWYFYFYWAGPGMFNGYSRGFGFSVRPVRESAQ